jgi:hypothetical protein
MIGQKLPLSMQEIWSIRLQLQANGRLRDPALFNLAINSKPRACDLLGLRMSDEYSGRKIQLRTIIWQRKAPSASKFRRKHENGLRRGSRPQRNWSVPFSFPAESIAHRISQRDSTPGSSTTG